MRLLRSDSDVVTALREVADALPASGKPTTIFLAGATAAILGHLLRRGRATTDCDVIRHEPAQAWDALAAAAAEVGRRRGLRTNWLSRECQMYAWALPLGWAERCEHVAELGTLDVWRLSRVDLICSKIMSAPKRPQDMEDLRQLQPRASDLEFAAANMERLRAESLDNETFEDQQSVIADLRNAVDEKEA